MDFAVYLLHIRAPIHSTHPITFVHVDDGGKVSLVTIAMSSEVFTWLILYTIDCLRNIVAYTFVPIHYLHI